MRYSQMLLAQAQPHAQWLNDFLALLPWIIIFLFIWVFIFRFMKRQMRRQKELDAAKAHAAALQQQLDQLTKKQTPPASRG